MEDPRFHSYPVSQTEYQASTFSIQPISRVQVGRPAQLDVAVQPTFQSQPPKINTAATPVRRKPVPNSASPSSAHTIGSKFFASSGQVVAVGDEEGDYDARPAPRPQEPPRPSQRTWLQPSSLDSPRLDLRNLDEYDLYRYISQWKKLSFTDKLCNRFPRGHSPLIPQSPGHSSFPKLSADQARKALLDLENNLPDLTIQDLVRRDYHASRADLHDPAESSEGESEDGRWNANAMLSRFRSTKDARPGQPIRSASHPILSPTQPIQQTQPTVTNTNGKPGVLNSFFGGWKTTAQAPDPAPIQHSPKTIPERSFSLDHVPQSPAPRKFSTTRRPTLHAIDVPKANATLNNYTNNVNHVSHPLPPPTPATSVRIEDMEQELREISTELASSIRRELELEDQIERLQLEVPQTSELSRRTSDYYSDSGMSSVRYPLSEAGGSKTDDVEKLRRRSEQEKAALRLDVSQKLQEERVRKKELEEEVRILEERVQEVSYAESIALGSYSSIVARAEPSRPRRSNSSARARSSVGRFTEKGSRRATAQTKL